MTKESERREYFRIEDEAYLTIQTVSEKEYNSAPEILQNLHSNSFSLSADFATLNNNIHPVLNNIRQIHPDIAEYLDFLNTKIDSLSQILLSEESLLDTSKLIKVNVSASGIMLKTTQNIKLNDTVKLELILLPEKIGILIFGRVINTNNDNNISIEFEHIRQQDHELMIKHNLNKQMADIRDKNDNN